MPLTITGNINLSKMTASRHIDHSLWVWSNSYTNWPTIATFCKTNGFKTVNISIMPAERATLATSQATINAALQPFTDKGIVVYFVAGDPNWAKNGVLPVALQELIDLAKLSGLVRGIQLDVEPHTLSDWNTNKPSIIGSFMDFLDATNAYMAGSGLLLGNIVHPAFASTTANPLPTLPSGYGTGNCADGIIARSDRIVTLAFRNTVSGLLTYAANILTSLDNNPKPWSFGITFNGGQTFTYVSYADRSSPWINAKTDMAAFMLSVKTRACGPLLEGVASQSYDQLLPYV